MSVQDGCMLVGSSYSNHFQCGVEQGDG